MYTCIVLTQMHMPSGLYAHGKTGKKYMKMCFVRTDSPRCKKSHVEPCFPPLSTVLPLQVPKRRAGLRWEVRIPGPVVHKQKTHRYDYCFPVRDILEEGTQRKTLRDEKEKECYYWKKKMNKMIKNRYENITIK